MFEPFGLIIDGKIDFLKLNTLFLKNDDEFFLILKDLIVQV